MARGEFGYSNSNSISYSNGGRLKWWCSYKRTTIIVCGINILVALYVFHSIFNSFYVYPFKDAQRTFRYNADQIVKMEESNRIRKLSEPTRLIKLMDQLKKELNGEDTPIELPQQTRQMITEEILLRLRGLEANANSTVQREAVESWRMEKLREAKGVIRKKRFNSSLSVEEAVYLQEALGADWPSVSEELGFWIPVEIVHTEHDDKPEGVEEPEQEVLPGKQLPPECQAELRSDYDGVAVKWGLTHNKESAYECCMACFEHAKHAKPDEKKCNIWVYCPSEQGCYSPDIYEHKLGECWLKYSENPKLNFKDSYSESYRNAHPNAPLVVPWVAGLVST
ncbi:hypothetical protein LIER_28575 [Lithospermum erythrorhizon]|uniref:Uncharacterized protein n=1 Tax=Lithospermum erythrorhizon TaxID=34254 RepID=A0AAV3RG58_LITER